MADLTAKFHKMGNILNTTIPVSFCFSISLTPFADLDTLAILHLQLKMPVGKKTFAFGVRDLFPPSA